MLGSCPFVCFNKSENGYCKTTGCINPKYQQSIFNSYSNNTFPSPCIHCKSNPVNGGSGYCNCTLATPKIT